MMLEAISENTQAILLLTAPLIVGRTSPRTDLLLTAGEYKRFARHLRELQHQPADLLKPDAQSLISQCAPVLDGDRLKVLLGRGFQLSRVVERWHSKAIWVLSRADSDYPSRLKTRLRDDAPAIIYGCGDRSLLESGGLVVVGSRNVDDWLLEYAQGIGKLAASGGKTIISGGARGIDQAAMRGAAEAGGRVTGVLADSLEKQSMIRDQRDLIVNRQVVLISPYDPNAGFNVGNAMQRNKVIYALCDAALVVNSDLKTGGTWAGAIEQLDKFHFVPVYVRSTGEPSIALEALGEKGAIAWPNPETTNELSAVLDASRDSVPITKNEDPSEPARAPVQQRLL